MGSIVGVIKEDTRSLDNGSYQVFVWVEANASELVESCRCQWKTPHARRCQTLHCQGGSTDGTKVGGFKGSAIPAPKQQLRRNEESLL